MPSIEKSELKIQTYRSLVDDLKIQKESAEKDAHRLHGVASFLPQTMKAIGTLILRVSNDRDEKKIDPETANYAGEMIRNAVKILQDAQFNSLDQANKQSGKVDGLLHSIARIEAAIKYEELKIEREKRSDAESTVSEMETVQADPESKPKPKRVRKRKPKKKVTSDATNAG